MARQNQVLQTSREKRKLILVQQIIHRWYSNLISGKGVEIIGKRPGEKLNETLISEKELPYTSKDVPHITSANYLSNERSGYVIISPNKQKNNLIEEYSSSNASMMTEQEMKEIIACPDEV